MRPAYLSLAAVLLSSAPAFAKSLQCNKAQTYCVIADSNDLTIGDRVGIFNGDGDLVATAEVSRMRDDRRTLGIVSRTGPIGKSDRVALLDTSAIDGTPPPVFPQYRPPSPFEVGASAGLATITVGDSQPGLEASAYAQWRRWGEWQLIARAVYEGISAKTSRPDFGADKLPFKMHGLGLLGGMGYEWFTSQPLSLRVEGGIGLMDITATVAGDKGPVDDGSANVHVKNGVRGYARWSVGAVYNVQTAWHVHADLVESIVDQAFANTLAFGLSHDLE